MAKPTKEQQRELNRKIEIIRRQIGEIEITKRRISRGISKRAFRSTPDRAS